MFLLKVNFDCWRLMSALVKAMLARFTLFLALKPLKIGTDNWKETNFEKLLLIDNNLIIFGDDELETFVKERRRDENTQFINKSLDWFKNNE